MYGQDIKNIVIAARDYGILKGVIGRLMTYNEANTIITSGSTKMKNIIFGKWTGADAPKVGYLRFWIGSASGNQGIWGTNPWSKTLDNTYYTESSGGVRPVLIVPES